MAGDVTHIVVQTWHRRDHFEFFREFAYPYWGITTDVDIAPLRRALRARDVSFTVGLVYVLLRSANAVPEFRQRIRGEAVVEHERIDAGVTILAPGDVFRFATVQYVESFNGRLRDELLNGEIFYTLQEARILIEEWRREYNEIRPSAAWATDRLHLRPER